VWRGVVEVGWEAEKIGEGRGVCFFGVFGRGLEIGREVDGFMDWGCLGRV